jgi:hypothetical protein
MHPLLATSMASPCTSQPLEPAAADRGTGRHHCDS